VGLTREGWFIRLTVATDVSDKGTMALCVSAASLKLVRPQIKPPPCFFDAGGVLGRSLGL